MARCPFAEWKPISYNVTRGGRQTIRGFVPHVQVGNGSLYGFFNRQKPPGQGASADFWCSKRGELEQYVDTVDQSWAQGSKEHNGNPTFVSCEFEGFPNEPMTAEQLDAGGHLISWVWSAVDSFPLQYNVDPDDSGITPHHVFGGGHTCPGPGPREGQFVDLIAAAKRWLGMEDEELTPELKAYIDAKFEALRKDVVSRLDGNGKTDDAGTRSGLFPLSTRILAGTEPTAAKVDNILTRLAALEAKIK